MTKAAARNPLRQVVYGEHPKLYIITDWVSKSNTMFPEWITKIKLSMDVNVAGLLLQLQHCEENKCVKHIAKYRNLHVSFEDCKTYWTR